MPGFKAWFSDSILWLINVYFCKNYGDKQSANHHIWSGTALNRGISMANKVVYALLFLILSLSNVQAGERYFEDHTAESVSYTHLTLPTKRIV